MTSREPTPEVTPRGAPQPLERKELFFDRIFNRQQPSSSSSTTTTTNDPVATFADIPPLPPIELDGYNQPKQILDGELAQDIRQLIPGRLQLEDHWQLVYSLDHDGVSLSTLYRHCDPKYSRNTKKREVGFGDQVVTLMIGNNQSVVMRAQGFIMVIRDEHNNRFGCFLNEHLRVVDSKRYYGNGECFLWKVEPVDDNNHRFKAFMYTGVNDNIIFSNGNFIAIGSLNGENGLYIDSLLDYGVSYRCDTFGNEVLNQVNDHVKMGRFKIYGLEIWRVG